MTRTTAALLAASLLGGCTSLGPFCFAPSSVDRLDLLATPDANRDAATAIDVVFALDAATADVLEPLDAATYFASHRARIVQNPSRALVRSWEVAPGQSLQERLDPPCGPAGTYVFVGHQGPDEFRFALPPASRLQVVIGRDDVEVATE